ncbi:MAG TPA: sugar ABC transporter permease [Firmicutes bacterium]|nr:sugar ABC transporter permease [Bacillota bacterium]
MYPDELVRTAGEELPSPRVPKKKKVSVQERKEHLIAFLFILPPIVGFLIFTALSVVFTFIYSFQNYNSLSGISENVGFANYIDLFTHVTRAPLFGKAIVNTLVLLLSVPFSMILGLILAGLLRLGEIKGSKFFQVLYYVPAVSSAVALNIVWNYIFRSNGVFNTLLGLDVIWLDGDVTIKVAIIFKNSLNSMGGAMILYLAGMLNVPRDLYEASSLDGAGKVRQFFSITLPLISPVTFYLLITGVIGGLQSYADAQVFAAGNTGATTIVYFIWQQGIQGNNNQGLASAASVLLAVLIMIVTLIQFKFSNKWVYEE